MVSQIRSRGYSLPVLVGNSLRCNSKGSWEVPIGNFLSFSVSFPLSFLRTTSQINCLHASLSLRSCFQRNPGYTIILLTWLPSYYTSDITWFLVESIVAVQALSYVWFFATPSTTACQASLSFTISQSLLKLTFIKLVMPSNHLILCCPLLLLTSIFPSIKVFSNESALRIRWPKYWSFSFSYQHH